MDQLWTDFLMKQAPVIVVLGLFCYFMYKHFTGQQDKKDITIKEKDMLLIETIKLKDAKIDEQSKSVMELYGRAIEAQNRNSEVQEQLLEIIKDTRESVRELNSKISSK
jgi:hypothetical protein